MHHELDETDLRVRADIERYGWHVAVVPPDEATPGAVGWAFTIGLEQSLRHPELVVFGLEPGLAQGLLNRAADAVRRGWRFEIGQRYEGLLEGYPCAVREVDVRWHSVFLGNAQWHYRGDGFAALQLFWPDPAKRFPWEEGFSEAWRADQPLLFLSTDEQALPSGLRASLEREGAL
ncbi:MAG TPA: DUF4262 domain-containing protein [Myxococcota bacterium]|jgi:hypothetical protein|nr:DUF4262 domain-containing protein [Myxococcota bacterium]